MEHYGLHQPPGDSMPGLVPNTNRILPLLGTGAADSRTSFQQSTSTPIITTSSSTGARVVYPPNAIPNPAGWIIGKRIDSVLGQLERPVYLPPDLDERVEKSSVWMKTIPKTGEAVFFVPSTCERCLISQAFCDRAEPSCTRCQGSGHACVPGDLRHIRSATVPVAKPNGADQRFSSAEKGKGKVIDNMLATADLDSTLSDNGELHSHDEECEGGRGMRIKKKRRLSDADELDPNKLNFDGTGIKRSRAKAGPRNSTVSIVTARPTRPEDVSPTDEDKKYLDRLEANSRKPSLKNTRGFCPVWANRRHALQAAVEYMRAPIRTDGASVEIGPSGLARGVILEGQAAGQGTYWGEGEHAGTIIVSIGKSRQRASVHSRVRFEPNLTPQNTTEDRNIADAYNKAWTQSADALSTVDGVIHNNGMITGTNGASPAIPASTTVVDAELPATEGTVAESPIIESLLLAHRAKVPVAVAVADDYSAVPFKVPRPILVLGWFWIVDAWTEPSMSEAIIGRPSILNHSDPGLVVTQVVWKFRFEWCSSGQPSPWWVDKNETERKPTPMLDESSSPASWPVLGPGVAGPTTLVGSNRPQLASDYRAMEAYHCYLCKCLSDKVYASDSMCLNERCEQFFRRVYPDRTTGPEANHPTEARAEQRILPESLRLTLASPEPWRTFHEVTRQDAQRDLWRAWVCKRCRLANERKDWFGFLCEACSLIDKPERKTYSDEALRSPSRPVYTGPRPYHSYAQWPAGVTRSSAKFEDDIIVVKHDIGALFGLGAQLFHALGHEGNDMAAITRLVLKAFQGQGAEEISFHRHPLPATSRRASELALSPFYTYLCGPEPVPFIAHFPTNHSIPWKSSPLACIDAIDVINERAGRMYPGEAERFNSLLIAVTPPSAPPNFHPMVPVQPHAYIALMILGSDGSIKVRKSSTATGTGRVRPGEIQMFHGDVVVLKTGSEPVDFEIKMNGFGFVCIARQVYRDEVTAGLLPLNSNILANMPSDPIKHSNKPPSKPPRLLVAPLSDWYVGCRPLDVTQPLRPHPALRDRPQSTQFTIDDENTSSEADLTAMGMVLDDPFFMGQEISDPIPPPPTLRAPSNALRPRLELANAAPLDLKSPSVIDDGEETIGPSVPSSGNRGRGRGRGRSSRGIRVSSSGNGQGRSGATATSTTPALSVPAKGEVLTPTSRPTSGPGSRGGRGSRGGGRGRGRGRGGGSTTVSSGMSEYAQGNVKKDDTLKEVDNVPIDIDESATSQSAAVQTESHPYIGTSVLNPLPAHFPSPDAQFSIPATAVPISVPIQASPSTVKPRTTPASPPSHVG